MSKASIDRIMIRARKEALPIVTGAVKAALPKGWRCVLAVGWGVTVFDDVGRTVDEDGSTSYGKSTHKWQAKLKRAVRLAEHFGDLYGLGNEQVRG